MALPLAGSDSSQQYETHLTATHLGPNETVPSFNHQRSMTPPGRTSEERERRRRKRRVASDSDRETGRRSAGGSRLSAGEGKSGRSSRGSRGGGSSSEKDIRDSLPTNFRAAISEFAPPLPPALLRKLEIKEVNGLGKVSTLHRTR